MNIEDFNVDWMNEMTPEQIAEHNERTKAGIAAIESVTDAFRWDLDDLMSRAREYEPPQPVVIVVGRTEADTEKRTEDTKKDTTENSGIIPYPTDSVNQQLVQKLKRMGHREKSIDVCREVAKESGKSLSSLKRATTRYRHLWKVTKSGQ